VSAEPGGHTACYRNIVKLNSTFVYFVCSYLLLILLANIVVKKKPLLVFLHNS